MRLDVIAIKELNKKIMENESLKQDIEREVAMCTALRSPFIVPFNGTCNTARQVLPCDGVC
jgi:hypothetical protein